MHEYSIVGALLNQVDDLAAEHGASAVHRLHVRIGALAGVEIDLLETAFELFRERTRCATATLQIHPVPVRWLCPRCEREIATGAALRCPDCSLPAQLAEGDEIILERIEMEVA
jgi:hydrogenase nickel incorporation protein HypA/HybF